MNTAIEVSLRDALGTLSWGGQSRLPKKMSSGLSLEKEDELPGEEIREGHSRHAR